MERFLQMIDPLKLERTSFEDRLARVKQRKSEEAEQQRLAAVKADEEHKAKAADLLPNLPSFIRRVCSGYAPDRGVLRTQSV